MYRSAHNRIRRTLISPANDQSIAAAASTPRIIALVAFTSLGFLALLGGLAAKAGGASMARGSVRVAFWGAFALTLTALIGRLFGTTV